MTRTIAPAPVRKTVTVGITPEEAFELFTAGISRWWPRTTHTILKAPLAEVIIEPHVGGRWYQKGVDGSECDTGRVLAWEPPDRIVLGWQLNGRWEFEPDAVSEVEVRFIAAGPGATEVRLEHRGLERFGESAAALRAGVDSPGGWPMLLAKFAETAGG